MKIAFLNDGAFAYAAGANSALGGAERDQWFLSRALVAAGWSATVGVRDHLKAGERKVLDGVHYVGIGQRQILLAWRNFLKAECPDWLFWECADPRLGFLVEIAKQSGIRTIFHAAIDSDVEPRHALPWRHRWWPLYAWALSRIDMIFVQHNGQLSGLRPRLQSKAYVLPKVCPLADAADGKLILKPHGERENYVAWVATLRQHKRPDILVEIARKAADVRFVVCGGLTNYRTPPGYCEQIIEALGALPNVEYRGQVTPEEAMDVIAGAALLLSTSDEEGFPNTFTQAWSAGTPVLSLTVDPDHIIERFGLGTVSGNADRAVVDINALMDSPQSRGEISDRARRFVAENYSASAVVQLFHRALDGVRK